MFTPGFQGYGSTTDGIRCIALASITRAACTAPTDSFLSLSKLRQQLWINPADAAPRGIANGDMLAVKSPAGRDSCIEAKVTPRIIPGTVGIPQGAWHKG